MITIILGLSLLITAVLGFTTLSAARYAERLRQALERSREDVRRLHNYARGLEQMLQFPGEPLGSSASREPLTSSIEAK